MYTLICHVHVSFDALDYHVGRLRSQVSLQLLQGQLRHRGQLRLRGDEHAGISISSIIVSTSNHIIIVYYCYDLHYCYYY